MSESVPFDLDAVEREASGEPFKFTLGGESFTLDSPEAADWRVDPRSPEGLQTLLRGMMGKDQFDRFEQHEMPGWKLGKLLEAAMRHYGVDMGESAASTRSSKRTARR